MNMKRTLTLASAILSLIGCSTTGTRKQDFTQTLSQWPADYTPAQRKFYVHNQIAIDAPPDAVWKVLIDYASWTDYYRGASEVCLADPAQKQLSDSSIIRWKTMGLRFSSHIREFVPNRRLAWESINPKIRGYHVWHIIPRGRGCLLVTEEAQRGWLTFFEKLFQPNKLHRLHDEWLLGIKTKAESSHGASTVR